jgi:NADH:ubiquinone oxidoreductase subunit F (NADH-binding)
VRAARAEGDPGKIVGALKASQLRGLGGAGFGTATKWEIVRDAPGDEKYIVCNADESEPGTIKDRYILDHAPHLVIEGMLLAALVTGARTGIIYIRHEYHRQKESLDRELVRCRGVGILDTAGGIPFDLTVFVSPGG